MLAAIIGFYCVKSFLGIDKISKAIAAIKCLQLLNMPISFSSMPLHFIEQFNQCPCDALEHVYSVVDSLDFLHNYARFIIFSENISVLTFLHSICFASFLSWHQELHRRFLVQIQVLSHLLDQICKYKGNAKVKYRTRNLKVIFLLKLNIVRCLASLLLPMLLTKYKQITNHPSDSVILESLNNKCQSVNQKAL